MTGPPQANLANAHDKIKVFRLVKNALKNQSSKHDEQACLIPTI